MKHSTLFRHHIYPQLLRILCVSPLFLFFAFVLKESVTPGYFPSYEYALWFSITSFSFFFIVVTAWNTASIDDVYYATVASPQRYILHHLRYPFSVGVVISLFTTVLLTIKVFSVTPGGSLPLWPVILLIPYFCFFSSIGIVIGRSLRGKNLLAILASTLVWILFYVSMRLHTSFSFLPVLFFDEPHDYSWIRVIPRVSALIILSVVSVLTAYMLIFRHYALSLLLIMSTALIMPSQFYSPRSTDSISPACTNTINGSSFCAWPEDRIGIEKINSLWKDYIDFITLLGIPPQKMTVEGIDTSEDNVVTNEVIVTGVGATIATMTTHLLESTYSSCVENEYGQLSVFTDLGFIAQQKFVPEDQDKLDITLGDSTHVRNRYDNWLAQTTEADQKQLFQSLAQNFRECQEPSLPWEKES